jgi:transposase
MSEFLIKKGLFIWLENPLQIKLSTGIKRDKNDRINSRDIALYALRHQDRAKCYRLPEASLKSLELLLSFRDRLLENKHSLLVSSKEIRSVIQRNKTARYIYEQSQREIERINREIKEIEAKMMELIESSDSMNENYKLVSSIKGVALIQ